MVYHANSEWLHGGFLGVEVFFVISGYLITLLLIAEHERSGRVEPAPVLAAPLPPAAAGAVRDARPADGLPRGRVPADAQGRTRGDIVGGVAYVSNWYQIFVGAGYTAREAFAPLRHLWSLAVEEQFYLLWPLIMVVDPAARPTRTLPAGRAVADRRQRSPSPPPSALLYVPGDIDSTCTPANMHGYWPIAGRCISVNDALYLGTFSRAGGLMLGAAFAMVWRPLALHARPDAQQGPPARPRRARRPRRRSAC